MAHELILLGQGPSRHDCPFDAETWTTVSALARPELADAEYTRAFCFDRPDRKADEAAGMEVAKARGIPIMGLDFLSHITEPYPLAEIQERFDTYYFKNDMSYMIAYALHKGYRDILLWGVDQGGGPPEVEPMYTMGRPYVMFWLGVATGMGVKWALAPDSILLREDEAQTIAA